jgi:anion-transporting  ArsA/GET3 family ATPase
MASLLESKLIVVTGKGGAGKTTVACALGLIAAKRGLRTIVAELGDQHRISDLFAAAEPDSDPGDPMRVPHARDGRHAEEVELQEDLWSTSINPEQALFEWLRTLGGRFSVKMLAASSTFQYFAAAAPGAKELVSLVKLRELCDVQHSDQSERRKTRSGDGRYDLVVLDAPATGHALAMLRSPQTFAAIVRAGPLAEQAQGVRELLEDRRRSAYVAVTHASEMAVTETLELEEGLRRHLDRDLDTVVVNGVTSRRFSKQELALIEAADERSDAKPITTTACGSAVAATRGYDAKHADAKRADAKHTNDEQLKHSAVRAARAAYAGSRVQQSQIARLRRQRFADGRPPEIATIPFLFASTLDLAALGELAAGLERKL